MFISADGRFTTLAASRAVKSGRSRTSPNGQLKTVRVACKPRWNTIIRMDCLLVAKRLELRGPWPQDQRLWSGQS